MFLLAQVSAKGIVSSKIPQKKQQRYLAKNWFPVSTNWTFLKLQGPNSEVFFRQKQKTHNPGVVVFKMACSESVGKGASSLSSL